MPLNKEQKQNIIKDLDDKLSRAKAAILVDFNKLPVSKTMELRKLLKKIGADYKVAKKSLISRVLNAKDYKGINLDELKSQIGIVFSYDDPVPVANSIFKFSKTVIQGGSETLRILGGFILARRSLGEGGGLNWNDKNKIIALAKLPSREIILGQLVGTIAAPLSGLVTVLSGNMRQLIGVLNNLKTKRS